MAERLDDGSEVPVEPDPAGHSIVTEGFQAQWSYEAEDETRTWVFRYRVACAVEVYTDIAHLYWQFIASGWTSRPSARRSGHPRAQAGVRGRRRAGRGHVTLARTDPDDRRRQRGHGNEGKGGGPPEHANDDKGEDE
jgi:hypothetical protein